MCISHSLPSPPRVHHGCVFISHLISSHLIPRYLFLSLYLHTYTQCPYPIALVRPSICIRSDVRFTTATKYLKPNARENAPSGSRKHMLVVVMRGWDKHAVITFNKAAARSSALDPTLLICQSPSKHMCKDHDLHLALPKPDVAPLEFDPAPLTFDMLSLAAIAARAWLPWRVG